MSYLGWVLLWAYILYHGFILYVAIKPVWTRMKIGHKVLVTPALVLFGVADVLFNATVGSLLFLEAPRQLTFSQRCALHLHDGGWRGKMARAFAVPLNTIEPGHIQ